MNKIYLNGVKKIFVYKDDYPITLHQIEKIVNKKKIQGGFIDDLENLENSWIEKDSLVVGSKIKNSIINCNSQITYSNIENSNVQGYLDCTEVINSNIFYCDISHSNIENSNITTTNIEDGFSINCKILCSDIKRSAFMNDKIFNLICNGQELSFKGVNISKTKTYIHTKNHSLYKVEDFIFDSNLNIDKSLKNILKK